jgi:hypothetical protein
LSEDGDGAGVAAGSDKQTMASGIQVGAEGAGPPVPEPSRPVEAESVPASDSQAESPEYAQAAEADDAQAAAPDDAQAAPADDAQAAPPEGAQAEPHADTDSPAQQARTRSATGDDQAELERLRAEVRDLRSQQAGGPGGKRGKGQGRWRAPVSAVLIVLGCILAPIAVIGVWGANQVGNTDRFVANMAPLISDPPIQHALSASITAQITSRIDVPAVTNQAAAQASAAHLPRIATLLHTFSGQIASAVNSAISTAVARVVASPPMAAVWTQGLRAVHSGVVRVLSGQGGGAVDVVGNKVVLNLAPLITQAKDQLSGQFPIVKNLPVVKAEFPLFEAPNLAKAQQGYRLSQTLKWVLPFLALALLAVGVYIARRHRRALIGAGLGLAASMLVLGIALSIARVIYLNSVPQSTLPSDAAGALYDTLVRFIRQGLRVLLVVGLLIAIGAFLTGPSVTAVRIRRAIVSGIDWLRTRGEQAGVHTGPVGEWTGAHKNLLRVLAIGLIAVIFLFWGQPTVGVVITLVVVLLVLLGLIELIGGREAAPRAAAER